MKNLNGPKTKRLQSFTVSITSPQKGSLGSNRFTGEFFQPCKEKLAPTLLEVFNCINEEKHFLTNSIRHFPSNETIERHHMKAIDQHHSCIDMQKSSIK